MAERKYKVLKKKEQKRMKKVETGSDTTETEHTTVIFINAPGQIVCKAFTYLKMKLSGVKVAFFGIAVSQPLMNIYKSCVENNQTNTFSVSHLQRYKNKLKCIIILTIPAFSGNMASSSSRMLRWASAMGPCVLRAICLISGNSRRFMLCRNREVNE